MGGTILAGVLGAIAGSILGALVTYLLGRSEREQLRDQVAALERIARSVEPLGPPGAQLSATIKTDGPRPPIERVFWFAVVRVTNTGRSTATLEHIEVTPVSTTEAGAVRDGTPRIELHPGEYHDVRIRFRNGNIPGRVLVTMRWWDDQGPSDREQHLVLPQ